MTEQPGARLREGCRNIVKTSIHSSKGKGLHQLDFDRVRLFCQLVLMIEMVGYAVVVALVYNGMAISDSASVASGAVRVAILVHGSVDCAGSVGLVVLIVRLC